MESMDLNFDAMALETLNLSKKLTESGSCLDFHDFSHLSELSEETFEDESLPESSGLIFRIDQGASTFCIRGIPCENICQSMDRISSGDCELLGKLKIEQEECDSLLYFETKSLAEAEMIRDQLINRRYPKHEEMICNISDPGFSWWMGHESGELKIYFNSYSVNRDEMFVKLGPVGDKCIAAHRFNQLEPLLRRLFPIKEFSSSEKGVVISTVGDSPLFDRFVELFSKGEAVLDSEEFTLVAQARTLYFYFQEMAVIRRFWLQVEELVDEKGGAIYQ